MKEVGIMTEENPIVEEGAVEESVEQPVEEVVEEPIPEDLSVEEAFRLYQERHGGGDSEEDVENPEDGDAEEEEGESEEEEGFVLKINGEEKSVSRDEVIQMAQKGEAANQKFQEASAILANVQEALTSAKSNPLGLLEKLGHKPEEFILSEAERILDEMEDPNKVALKKKEQELENKRKELEQQEHQRRMEIATQQAQVELDNEINKAFETSGVKPNRVLITGVAKEMMSALDQGKRISALDALQAVQERTQNDVKEYLSSSKVEELIDKLPKEFVEGLRQHFVSKVSKGKAAKRRPTKQKEQQKQRKAVSIDELLG